MQGDRATACRGSTSPLQSGSRFREPRKIFWHDLPWIIDQGSRTPSRVPFLLATSSYRRGRRPSQSDMIRRGALQRRRRLAGTAQRFAHAGTEQEREQELLHCWRSIALPFSERRTGVPEEGGAPSELGETQETQRTKRKSNGRGERGWNGLVSGEAAPGALFIHGLQGRGWGSLGSHRRRPSARIKMVGEGNFFW